MTIFIPHSPLFFLQKSQKKDSSVPIKLSKYICHVPDIVDGRNPAPLQATNLSTSDRQISEPSTVLSNIRMPINQPV